MALCTAPKKDQSFMVNKYKKRELTKSPIKAKPLRNPGEGLAQRIEKLRTEGLMENGLVVSLLFALTAAEWVRWYFDTPPNPVLMTVLLVLGLIHFSWKITEIKKSLRPLQQGLQGEKSVGQYLEGLREQGAKVYHDIPGEGFNLDHVIIHKSGVYVIETKTYSKPVTGNPVIRYDGKSLYFTANKARNEPLVQARAAARWLQDLLEESTGDYIPVKPVVVFPGWFIDNSDSGLRAEVWVLNPKALPSFISKRKTLLPADRINMIALHLSRFIRSSTG